MVAPVTGQQNMGVMRAEVKQGVRQVIGCKDGNGKIGIRVQHIKKGVFVSFVQKDSPASMAGKFYFSILSVNARNNQII